MKFSEAQNLASDLRNLADFIEEHGAELPRDTYGLEPKLKLNIWCHSKAEMAKGARVLSKAGMVKKDFSNSYATIIKEFGNHVSVECTSPREQVCTRKVVGTETVPKKVYVTIPNEFEDREIVEWECDPILAD